MLLFLFLFLGMQSRISVCGSWMTSPKSLKMKVNNCSLLCLQVEATCSKSYFWRKYMVRQIARSVIGKWVYLFVFDRRCWVPEGQVWTVRWTIEPLHSGCAVYEWGEYPVRSGHGAAGDRIQTFSQQEEICHRYVVDLIIHMYLILFFFQCISISNCTYFVVFFRTLYGRLLRWPTTLVWKEKNLAWHRSWQLCKASWTSGSIWAQSCKRESHYN